MNQKEQRLLKQAYEYYEANDYSNALRIGEKILKHSKSLPTLNLMGATLAGLKRYERALDYFKQALSLNKQDDLAWNNIGNILYFQEKYEEAEKYYLKSIELNPEASITFHNLAETLRCQEKYEQAEEKAKEALALEPANVLAYNTLGIVYNNTKKYEEAEKIFLKALSLDNNKILDKIYNNLGDSFFHREEFEKALECYNKSFSINQGNIKTYKNFTKLIGLFGIDENSIQNLMKLVDHHPDDIDTWTYFLFNLHYVYWSREQTYKQHVRFADAFLAKRRRKHKHKYKHLNSHNKKLRIGYMSGDFNRHPVAFFMLPIFEHHNHDEFEFFCYYNKHPDLEDEYTKKLKVYIKPENWRYCLPIPDDVLEAQILHDQIDILIDLHGHTAYNRLGVFMRKPAPIQVSYLGYFDTTGLPEIDYRIVDKIVEPPETAQQYSAEKLIYLPHSLYCFRPTLEVELAPSLPALKNRYITFGSFSNVNKLNAPHMLVWVELLRRISSAKLIIKAAQLDIDSFIEAFIAQGIEKDRVSIVPYNPNLEEHYTSYHEIDITLDTFPYNGGTTTIDSLWMGVPVLTLQGDRHVSRLASSFLDAVGLQDWIARSEIEYINKALHFSRNIELLSELRSGLRQRMLNSPLMQELEFTQNLEKIYQSMWQDYCNKS